MDALMFASYHYARNVGWYSLKESQAGRVGWKDRVHRQKEAANRSAQPTTKATKDNVLLAATTFPRVACGKIKIGHR